MDPEEARRKRREKLLQRGQVIEKGTEPLYQAPSKKEESAEH